MTCSSSFLSRSFTFPSVIIVLFFFFKQKTAYEMRISDWSSDVCSSDLRSSRARSRTAARQSAARLPRCANAKPRSSSPLRARAPRMRSRSPSRSRGRKSLARPQQMDLADDVAFHGRPEVAPVEGGRAGHEQQMRSEEHTSELQSLMRNSDAVFCLK